MRIFFICTLASLACVAILFAGDDSTKDQPKVKTRSANFEPYQSPTMAIAWKPGNLTPEFRRKVGPVETVFRFKSAPEGADVYVDGTFVGTTPTVELKQEVGQHAILIRKAGYADWNKKAALTAGDKLDLFAEMEAKATATGKLHIIGLD